MTAHPLPTKSGSTKYLPLMRFLAAQPPETMRVTLTLREVARLVGTLPAGAAGVGWWGNTRRSPQGRAWLDAGWQMQRVQLCQAVPAVTFVRAETSEAPRAAAPESQI